MYDGYAVDILFALTIVHLYCKTSHVINVYVCALDGDLRYRRRCFDSNEATERPLDSVSLEGISQLRRLATDMQITSRADNRKDFSLSAVLIWVVIVVDRL